jgi:hypothetical protein
MIRVAGMSLVLLLILQPYYAANAAPAYPFEGLLPRAETVFIGRITKHAERDVTFEVVEALRGRADQPTLTFGFSGLDDRRLPTAASSYLVISQGDNHFGKPKAIVSLGQALKGQAGYCGWIAFPIRVDGRAPYLDLINTSVGRKPGEKPARLTLDAARELTQQVTYSPDLQGNGV